MALVDGTVVNVALPTLQSKFDATAGDVQWIVEAYALLLSALILTGGALGDRFGRRRMFAAGVAVFAAASAACGLATSPMQLIIARGAQGAGGAFLVPGSLALISASFAGAARGRAIGTWSGFSAIAAAIGPVVGGWLIQHSGWRAIFFINVPLAAVVLAITIWRVPESRDDDAKSIDWPGAMLVTISLGAIVYGLISASESGFGERRVIAALALGLVVLGLFVIVERRARTPMVPTLLWSSRTFIGANVLTLFLYAALGGMLFFLPFDLIAVHGYSPTAAGASLLPLTVLMFALSRWSGALVGRYGARRPLIVGPTIAAAGFGLFALPGTGGTYWTTFFPAVTVLGIGLAVSVAPLTTAVMNSVDTHRAGVASGVNNAVARTAGLMAVALFGVVALSTFTSTLRDRLQTPGIPASARAVAITAPSRLAAIKIPEGTNPTDAAIVQREVGVAFTRSFRIVALLAAGLALASALTTVIMIQDPPHSQRAR